MTSTGPDSAAMPRKNLVAFERRRHDRSLPQSCPLPSAGPKQRSARLVRHSLERPLAGEPVADHAVEFAVEGSVVRAYPGANLSDAGLVS